MPTFDTVFFLSDYGRSDEFVGIVHAVFRRLAPEVTVVDLTHDIASFDVRAGAWALARSVPHLGSGVVLAVVDPGVGGTRRGVALKTTISGAAQVFVGPDNGLLLPAIESVGGIEHAVSIDAEQREDILGGGARSTTFDGRDLFAPVAAAICRGCDLGEIGLSIEPSTLVRLPGAVVEFGRLSDGRRRCRAEVMWIDHFGNVQLAVRATEVADARMMTLTKDIGAPQEQPILVRRVNAFVELMAGEVGLLADANGHLALVLPEGSAAAMLGILAGDLIDMAW